VKVLIIGLDGATWNVLDDYLLDNHMPNLNRLKKEGSSGVLQSTNPPITPAAWTTCITGCQPYTHGVFRFENYSFKDDLSCISSAANCNVPTIWQELSKQGYKVASINVPWTYPCRQVNGIIVAGYGLPSTNVQFTYPNDFKSELLKHIPDYDVVAKWEKLENHDFAKLETNICRVERCFEQRLETAELVNKKITPDIMMVQFQDLDMIQHHIWPYVDKTIRDQYPTERDRLFSMFEKLDQTIGALLRLTDNKIPIVAVISDHGLCRVVGSIKVNMLLHDWGYLKLKSPIGLIVRRIRRNLHSLSSRPKSSMPFELKTLVDWKRSKAMAMNTEMYGHVYLNVKGRNPCGCVDPGGEYENIIREICLKFSQLTNPVTREPIFAQVVTPSQLYNDGIADVENMGDIVLIPNRGYSPNRKISKKGYNIELMTEQSFFGCHCSEGIYVFCGSNIKSGENKNEHIVDIAPTIYAAMGAKLPVYLDGTVLSEIFTEPPNIEYLKDKSDIASKTIEQHQLSDQEQQAIAKRLSELGYL
jgi:predicted AlkP superfamily phosphohydrolase/phosphomutase